MNENSKTNIQNNLLHHSLISIIVPVYNVEKYLPRCIDSIINQTYPNFEVILVNDGSTDQSGNICDEYAKKDNRIRVVHKANGGLSDARNKGIDYASGEYIGFIDSDDFIHPEMYEILLKNLLEADADISVCDFQEIFDYSESNTNINNNTKSLSSEDALYLYFNEATAISAIACNKLYKRMLFNEVRYPYQKFHEDEFTTFKLFYFSNRIVYSDAKLYYYFRRQDSITGIVSERRLLHQIESIEEGLVFFIEKGAREFISLSKSRYFMYLIQKFLEFKVIDDRKYLKMIHKLFKEKKRTYKRFSSSSNYHEFIFTFFSVYPSIFCLMIKLRKKL